jgi:hypothetical protein
MTTYTVNNKVFSRKSYDVAKVLNNVLPNIKFYAHGWLEVPSKSSDDMYAVHMNMKTLEAESCTCYNHVEQNEYCFHMLAADVRFNQTVIVNDMKRADILNDRLLLVFDPKAGQKIPSRVCFFTAEELTHYQKQLAREEAAVQNHRNVVGQLETAAAALYNELFDPNYINDSAYQTANR